VKGELAFHRAPWWAVSRQRVNDRGFSTLIRRAWFWDFHDARDTTQQKSLLEGGVQLTGGSANSAGLPKADGLSLRPRAFGDRLAHRNDLGEKGCGGGGREKKNRKRGCHTWRMVQRCTGKKEEKTERALFA